MLKVLMSITVGVLEHLAVGSKMLKLLNVGDR